MKIAKSFKNRRWALALPLVALAFAGFFFYASWVSKTKIRSMTAAAAKEEASYLLRNLNDRLTFLVNDLLEMFKANPPRSQHEHLKRTKHLIEANPFLQTINYIGPDRRIKFVSPSEANKSVIGLKIDIAAPKQALEMAASSRRPYLSDPFEIIQGRQGYSLMVPYSKNTFFEVVLRAESVFGPESPFRRKGEIFLNILDKSKLVHSAPEYQDQASLYPDYKVYVEGTMLNRRIRISAVPAASLLNVGSMFWRLLSAGSLVFSFILLMLVVFFQMLHITERKRAEEEIRKHRDRLEELVEERTAELKSIFRAAPVGIGMAVNRVIKHVNDSMCKMLGYSQEELLGKEGRILYPTQEDYEYVGREKYAQINERGTGTVETRWLRKDGEVIDVLLSSSVLDPEDLSAGVTFTALDITERKRAEEALKETHKELERTKQYIESLIESSTDPIIATDKEGNVIFFNEGAETLSGYLREEVIGRRTPVLYERETDAKEVMRRVREGGGTLSAFETTFRAKDGTRIPVLISASILYDEKGQEAGTVGISKDLRERKRAEEELWATHDGLQKAYERLEQAQEQLIRSEKMAAVGKLTAGVSHEVLNPLNIITMSLHLLIENPETPPEITDQMRVLKGQADRIAKITQDLLHVARQRPPERRSIDFNETVKHTMDLMEYDLRLNNVTVEFNLVDELPPVYADQDQLQQVILNLLANARDAMPEGGRLSLSTGTVRSDGRTLVELRVEDTGPGIDPEHLENLFDPFFTTKDEGEGTGLGLSICQGIVEAHGGDIWAENGPGGGAAFVVRLGVEEA